MRARTELSQFPEGRPNTLGRVLGRVCVMGASLGVAGMVATNWAAENGLLSSVEQYRVGMVSSMACVAVFSATAGMREYMERRGASTFEAITEPLKNDAVLTQLAELFPEDIPPQPTDESLPPD